MTSQPKISIVIQAVDKATASIRAINGTIAKMAAPARATSRSMESLFKATGYVRVSKAVDGVGRSMRSLATTSAIISGALGAGAFALTRITNAGEAATKAAQQFGTTVPEWQKLAYAAEIADVGAEELGQSLGALNKRAIAAATGNQEAAIWFRRAGLSVLDQNGKVKTSTELMAELADVFEKMPDGPKKLALANGLLKDTQGKLIPLLNGGSKGLRDAGKEAEAFGLMNEQLARDSALFNDELKKTRGAAMGVGNAIGASILPSINELMPGLRNWIVNNRELFAGIGKGLFEGLSKVGVVIGYLLKAVNSIVQKFGGWSTVVYAISGFIGAKLVFALLGATKSFLALGVAILTTPIGWFLAGIAAIAGGAYLLIKHWDKVKAWFLDFIDTVLAPVRILMEKITAMVPDFIKNTNASNNGGTPKESPVAGIAAAKQQRFGGRIDLHINGAPARVTKMETDGGLDLDVYSMGLTSAAR